MNTGIHGYRPGGGSLPPSPPAARPSLGDYAERRRAAPVMIVELRGISHESEYFRRIHERDRRSALPDVAESDPAMEALNRLLVMQPGWDGSRAPAPSQEAINIARGAVAEARSAELGEARVVADVEGGVAVYFFGGEKLADGGWSRQGGFLVSNDSEVSLYLRDRRRRGSDIAEIEPCAESLARAVRQIRDFVSGR